MGKKVGGDRWNHANTKRSRQRVHESISRLRKIVGIDQNSPRSGYQLQSGCGDQNAAAISFECTTSANNTVTYLYSAGVVAVSPYIRSHLVSLVGRPGAEATAG